MQDIFSKALEKIVRALDQEEISYMIVGGFAVSYYNRARTTNDIDIVLQIYPAHVSKILKHFPDWSGFQDSFEESVLHGRLFNITDFETGIRYDFLTYKDSDYNWTAFERREQVELWGVDCYLCSREDLIIAKLKWYNISQSEKQWEDLQFLLLDNDLDRKYLQFWVQQLNLETHGLLG